MTNPPDNSTVISDLPLAKAINEGDSILTQRSDKSLVKMPANLLKGQKGDCGAQGPQGETGKDATAPPLSIFPYYGEIPPEGFLLLQGQTFYPEMYPILAKKFPSNILPDFRNRVPRGVGDLIGLGDTQEDALQNITGNVGGSANGSVGYFYPSNCTGAFQATENNCNAPPASGSIWRAESATFDASRVARTADETRVKAIGVNFIIKAA